MRKKVRFEYSSAENKAQVCENVTDALNSCFAVDVAAPGA